MNEKQIPQAFRDMFPGSQVVAEIDDIAIPEKPHRQPLYCNYQGRLRAVDDPVCQYHLETFDPWCWERCETEWAINKLRPAREVNYREHMALEETSNSRGDANMSLWK